MRFNPNSLVNTASNSQLFVLDSCPISGKIDKHSVVFWQITWDSVSMVFNIDLGVDAVINIVREYSDNIRLCFHFKQNSFSWRGYSALCSRSPLKCRLCIYVLMFSLYFTIIAVYLWFTLLRLLDYLCNYCWLTNRWFTCLLRLLYNIYSLLNRITSVTTLRN